ACGNVAQADALATSVVRMLLVIIGALGALTLFCLHFRLWPNWLRNVGLDGSTILSLLVTYISVQLLAACAQVYLRGRQDFANLAKLCAASFALQLVAVSVGGLLLRIEGIIVGYIVGQIPLAAVALRLMTKSGRIDKSLSSRIRRYGLYSWAANIGSAVV